MDFLSNTDNIRNICILAHVDHGKTTIADSLIASNGIISQRLAGKMRYLDNRQDEQERGITMKSSSIALKYTDDAGSRFLINLIDTPGHVDFCGEVSAAVRLCDGALIVIDVVEGVCPQTKVALEQAWKEGIKPILVLNKIDRLVLEQQLDETAAYLRLNQILEQVNAIVATLLTTEIFGDEANQIEQQQQKTPNHSNSVTNEGDDEHGDSVQGMSNLHVYDWAGAIEDIDDSKYYFMPEKNNVVFVSALDDWAFTIGSFSEIISSRYKINTNALRRTLWGDFYVDLKQKKILKNAQAKSKKNLFISMVLENIWKLYDTVVVRRDKVTMEKMCQALGIELSSRDQNHTDARHQIKLIMNKWLNLSKNTLASVASLIPSPKGLNNKRIERLLSSNLNKNFERLPAQTQALKESFLACSAHRDAVKVACISKMIPFERKNLPENRRDIIRIPKSERELVVQREHNKLNNLTDIQEQTNAEQPASEEGDTVFIAFARIFSGRLEKGDKLYVLGPRHDPSKVNEKTESLVDHSKQLDDLAIDEHITVATVEDFYLLMGRELESLNSALAGNIVGIKGLDKHLIRTATISNSLYCSPFNDLHMAATPILRVAIEPKNPLEMSTLVRGLKLLNQADPCVEVRLQHTGEHVIVATGEVHLQHCLKDLKEIYANNIELNVSAPIVPFRETIVLPPKTDMVNEAIDQNNMEMTKRRQPKSTPCDGIIEITTPNKRCLIKLRASPLPDQVRECLLDNVATMRAMSKTKVGQSKSTSTVDEVDDQESEFIRKQVIEFKSKLAESMHTACGENNDWASYYNCDNFVNNIWSFGPKYFGPNLLLCQASSLKFKYDPWTRHPKSDDAEKLDQIRLSDYIDSFVSGFQLASLAGPLCEEPMVGVCISVIEWTCLDHADDQLRDAYGPMSGQIISTVKEACRRAFQSQPQRLMSPMFSCDIQVTADALGRMYAVLGRRHGRIVQGDMRTGSQTFEVKAFIPVIESIDFANEIRDQTSGMANPQLIFSHYELIDVDPFWTPSTEEEYALYGEKADTENIARKYMNLVRRRKGLSVDEKIVEHGEKQRTVKRNK